MENIEACVSPEILPSTFELARFSGIDLKQRNRLISMMLQDRGVVRVISAPHGYGKTLLAYEYARRVFGRGRVVWVDGSSPEFLQAVDEGHLVPRGVGDEDEADLVIVDDLPTMDEQRIEVFVRCADALLFKGCEVVVTCLPSRDWLRSTQPDRVLVAAGDLLVTKREVEDISSGAEVRKAALASWQGKGSSLMGFAPRNVWGDGAEGTTDCLRGFFAEDLELDFLKAGFAMLLLGKGACSDLERLGIALPEELLQMAAHDYLFLGLDLVQREFRCGYVSVETLKGAIEAAGAHDYLLAGAFPVYEKALGLLLENGDMQRATEVMDAFCANAHCETWLREYGWELLDSGEEKLLSALLSRCRDEVLSGDAGMLAMRSWVCGMNGEGREAAFYARQVMRLCEYEGQRADNLPLLMANLALMAFSGERDESAYGELEVDGDKLSIASSGDFLVALSRLCTQEELERSVAVLRGNLAPSSIRGSKSKGADEGRVERIETLFGQHAHRFGDCIALRVAVHVLSCIDSASARELLHRYGCGLLIGMRKKGVSGFSQAVTIGDLWRSGYFGIDGKTIDIRDSKLLSQASTMLMKMCRMAGHEAPMIPWERSKTPVVVEKPGKPSPKSRKKKQLAVPSKIPVANVTLFGGLEVVIGEKYIPRSKWTTRALQLFAILVMNQGRDVSRDVIFQQMWPDLSRTRALDNFYTAWSRMQALFGEGPYLSRNGEFCSVSARYVTSDIAEFEQLSKRILVERDNMTAVLDIYARMEALYRGGLLPSEKGNEFIDRQRRRYQAIFVDAMISGVYKSLEAKDSRIALWFARKAIEEDAAREDSYAALMKAQMAAGQRCSAIRTYFQCKDYLREELGLDPSAETQSLYEQLIASDPSLLKLAAMSSLG